MANPFAPERRPRQIELSRRVVLGGVMVVTWVAGTLFSTAALAAGVQSPDLLAMVFALGASSTLFVILVWYLSQLARAEAARHRGSTVERRNRAIQPGAPWTQPRRPPSGSTIMWAASLFRRSTDAPSIR